MAQVVPHTTTGRADFFGVLVNRAARCCHANAAGGQVVAPVELVEQVLRGLLPPLELVRLMAHHHHHHEARAPAAGTAVAAAAALAVVASANGSVAASARSSLQPPASPPQARPLKQHDAGSAEQLGGSSGGGGGARGPSQPWPAKPGAPLAAAAAQGPPATGSLDARAAGRSASPPVLLPEGSNTCSATAPETARPNHRGSAQHRSPLPDSGGSAGAPPCLVLRAPVRPTSPHAGPPPWRLPKDIQLQAHAAVKRRSLRLERNKAAARQALQHAAADGICEHQDEEEGEDDGTFRVVAVAGAEAAQLAAVRARRHRRALGAATSPCHAASEAPQADTPRERASKGDRERCSGTDAASAAHATGGEDGMADRLAARAGGAAAPAPAAVLPLDAGLALEGAPDASGELALLEQSTLSIGLRTGARRWLWMRCLVVDDLGWFK